MPPRSPPRPPASPSPHCRPEPAPLPGAACPRQPPRPAALWQPTSMRSNLLPAGEPRTDPPPSPQGSGQASRAGAYRTAFSSLCSDHPRHFLESLVDRGQTAYGHPAAPPPAPCTRCQPSPDVSLSRTCCAPRARAGGPCNSCTERTARRHSGLLAQTPLCLETWRGEP